MNVPLNIDWQQILLHLFNFLILAGGLYLLLYKPVKAFMEKRNAYYADLDAAANKKNEDAEATKKQYQDRLEAAEVEISNMKKQAADSAKKTEKELLAQANEERRAILEKAEKEAAAEKQKILASANKEIEALVSDAVDKLLTANGTESLDDFLDKAEKED